MTEHDIPHEIVSADIAKKTGNTASQTLGFWGLYHAADAMWVGGALAGD